MLLSLFQDIDAFAHLHPENRSRRVVGRTDEYLASTRPQVLYNQAPEFIKQRLERERETERGTGEVTLY